MSPPLRGDIFCAGCKRRKKPGSKPWKCGNYSLTKSAQYDTLIIHTVILCLPMDFTSNEVILPQDRDNVKHQDKENRKTGNCPWRIVSNTHS